MPRLPYFPFYAGDWLKDPNLRSCSLAARGLWIDMLSLMDQLPRRGFLQLGDHPITPTKLARMVGSSPDEVHPLLQELVDAGVCSTQETKHGPVVLSRRMVRDERDREQTRQRVKRHRYGSVTPPVTEAPCNATCNGGSNARVTPENSEVRSQKNNNTHPSTGNSARGPSPPAPPACPEDGVVVFLRRHGVSRREAADLARQGVTAELAQRAVKAADRKGKSNPAGYIVSFLRQALGGAAWDQDQVQADQEATARRAAEQAERQHREQESLQRQTALTWWHGLSRTQRRGWINHPELANVPGPAVELAAWRLAGEPRPGTVGASPTLAKGDSP